MLKLRGFSLPIAVAVLLSAVAIGCKSVDDERIPVAPVKVDFVNVGSWNAYGVGGALDYRKFIKSERIPAGFPYTAMMATGFGGVLLVCGYEGEFKAYDLACPVERKNNVRINVDADAHVGVCPVCHSTYDIYRFGSPLSGVAAENGYGLTRYNVGPGPAGEYMVISR